MDSRVVSFSGKTTEPVPAHKPEVKMPSRAAERINFGKIKEVIAPPNLIEIQINSYHEFSRPTSPPPSGRTSACKRSSPKLSHRKLRWKVRLDYHS